MDTLPSSPTILLSYVNTKLRDDYASLDELCDALDCDRDFIINTLRSIDYEYSEELNQFKSPL